MNYYDFFTRQLFFFFVPESKLLNFFGERSSKEFVVENFFMRVSEDNEKTTLKEIYQINNSFRKVKEIKVLGPNVKLNCSCKLMNLQLNIVIFKYVF